MTRAILDHPDYAQRRIGSLQKGNAGTYADYKRIVEGPDDFEQFEIRDPATTYTAYVPPGSIALGKQLAAQVEQSSQIIQDPVIAEYVNRLGQNIVRNSDAQVPFTIKVVDSDEVNAFALPGANVSNASFNADGSIRALNGFGQITATAPLGRIIDQRYFRFSLRLLW